MSFYASLCSQGNLFMPVHIQMLKLYTEIKSHLLNLGTCLLNLQSYFFQNHLANHSSRNIAVNFRLVA
jgi:hypothetical protein